MKRNPIQYPLHYKAGAWGGWRPGAGAKKTGRNAIAHESREPVAGYHPCHVTLKVRSDVPSLRSRRLVRALEESFRKACERGKFRLVHYSIQKDHLHLIVEAHGRDALGCGMKSLGARVARAVNRVFERTGPVLKERYHLHVLKTPREVRNALRYVLLNARRHGHGRTRGASKLDPASSGRWFKGWKHRVEVASDPPAVAGAHTWLLQRGWRRLGRLDPGEVPG